MSYVHPQNGKTFSCPQDGGTYPLKAHGKKEKAPTYPGCGARLKEWLGRSAIGTKPNARA